MIQKKSYVKILPSEEVCEYLHNLDGHIVKIRKRIITKRTKKSNYNPKKVGETTEYCVDLSNHNNRNLDDSTSKHFWFEAKHLMEV